MTAERVEDLRPVACRYEVTRDPAERQAAAALLSRAGDIGAAVGDLLSYAQAYPGTVAETHARMAATITANRREWTASADDYRRARMTGP